MCGLNKSVVIPETDKTPCPNLHNISSHIIIILTGKTCLTRPTNFSNKKSPGLIIARAFEFLRQ